MSLNPRGTSNSWNYSRPDDDGYSNSITGTVVFLQEVQSREYSMNGQPGAPSFWPEGKPKMNIRMGLALADGSLRTFTFQPAGKKQKNGEKPSVHMDLFRLAGGVDMMNLIGKTITIETWPSNPQTGQMWGNGNPRLFQVSEVPGVAYYLNAPLPAEYQLAEVLCDDAASGGQVVPPQNIQVPQQPMAGVQPGGMYPAPQAMPQPPVGQHQHVPPQFYAQTQQYVAPAPVPTPAPAQPAPQPVQQPAGTVQPMQPAVPAGMDPAIAAAMQQVGATNVQPVAEQPGLYEDVPF